MKGQNEAELTIRQNSMCLAWFDAFSQDNIIIFIFFCYDEPSSNQCVCLKGRTKHRLKRTFINVRKINPFRMERTGKVLCISHLSFVTILPSTVRRNIVPYMALYKPYKNTPDSIARSKRNLAPFQR